MILFYTYYWYSFNFNSFLVKNSSWAVCIDLLYLFKDFLEFHCMDALWFIEPIPYWLTLSPGFCCHQKKMVQWVHFHTHLWDLMPKILKNESFQVELLGKRKCIFYILIDTAKTDHNFTLSLINIGGVSSQWLCFPCTLVGSQLWMEEFAESIDINSHPRLASDNWHQKTRAH